MHTAVNVTHLMNDSLVKLLKYLSYFMREMIYQLSEWSFYFQPRSRAS